MQNYNFWAICAKAAQSLFKNPYSLLAVLFALMLFCSCGNSRPTNPFRNYNAEHGPNPYGKKWLETPNEKLGISPYEVIRRTSPQGNPNADYRNFLKSQGRDYDTEQRAYYDRLSQ